MWREEDYGFHPGFIIINRHTTKSIWPCTLLRKERKDKMLSVWTIKGDDTFYGGGRGRRRFMVCNECCVVDERRESRKTFTTRRENFPERGDKWPPEDDSIPLEWESSVREEVETGYLTMCTKLVCLLDKTSHYRNRKGWSHTPESVISRINWLER